MNAALKIKPKRKNAKAEVNDPYADGADAAMSGGDLTINPHEPGTPDHNQWISGWKSVREDTTIE